MPLMFQSRPQDYDNLQVITEWLDVVLRNFAHGTWTPTITFATPGDLNVAYSTRVGYWYRLGLMVFLQFDLATSSFTHTTASGNLQITGNPFSGLDYGTGSVIGHGVAAWRGITKANYTQATWRINEASATILLDICGSGQAAVTVASGDMPTGGTVRLRGLLIFPTAI